MTAGLNVMCAVIYFRIISMSRCHEEMSRVRYGQPFCTGAKLFPLSK